MGEALVILGLSAVWIMVIFSIGDLEQRVNSLEREVENLKGRELPK